MPNLTSHHLLPPFPDDIETAPLVSVSFKDLEHRDANASTALFKACKELGFFYLDLFGSELGEKIIEESEDPNQRGDNTINYRCEYASSVAHVTVPSLKHVFKLELSPHLDNNNNNGDGPVRIFAITFNNYQARKDVEALPSPGELRLPQRRLSISDSSMKTNCSDFTQGCK